MAGEQILIIEDDAGIASLMRLELTHEGYAVTTAASGTEGLELFTQQHPDLILLDIMLPGLSGLEVLRRIRKTAAIPVILVTARSETADTVAGLDAGADDYITKPFEIEELLARIRSMLRRSGVYSQQEQQHSRIRIRDIVIDTDACTVTKNDLPVNLSRTEYMLLLCLASNKSKAMTREQIIDCVWGEDHYIDVNSVDVYVRYLRAKLDDKDTNAKDSLITTLRGIGYRISGE